MSPAAVRTAMKSQLAAAITGVNWFEIFPDNVTPPTGAIERMEGPDRETLGLSGTYRCLFDVVVIVAPLQNGVATARRKVDAYVADSGASSIRAALEADPSLSGAVDVLVVQQARDDNPIEINGIAYDGVRIPCEIWAP